MMTLKAAYTLHEQIASGRFGTVYRGTHVPTGRTVAIKQLPIKRQDVASHRNAAMLKQEVQHWQKVSSKSDFILPLNEVIFDDGIDDHSIASCYLISPFCSGGTWRTSAINMPLDQKYHAVRQMAMALATCHENNILHGDIKPDNVLIESSRTYLADFGSSVPCDNPLEGAFISWMTLNYVPPEAMLRSAASTGVGRAADMWAFGVTVYELMHDMKALPFQKLVLQSASSADRGRLSLIDPPYNDPLEVKQMYWPSDTRHTITNHKTHQLCEVILGCLERDPNLRINARDVLRIL